MRQETAVKDGTEHDFKYQDQGQPLCVSDRYCFYLEPPTYSVSSSPLLSSNFGFFLTVSLNIPFPGHMFFHPAVQVIIRFSQLGLVNNLMISKVTSFHMCLT